jgi:hypothetical protein
MLFTLCVVTAVVVLQADVDSVGVVVVVTERWNERRKGVSENDDVTFPAWAKATPDRSGKDKFFARAETGFLFRRVPPCFPLAVIL